MPTSTAGCGLRAVRREVFLILPFFDAWHRFLPGMRRIAGTRPYIAPETIQRRLPDFRTDIYSFGVTLFELLTRRPPFISINRDELLNMHLRQPPPWPWTFNKNLTREINDLIVAMLEKRPERRPQSMADVYARLKRIRIYEKPPAEAAAARRASS
jgi:serine/threonine protein kinase